MGSLFIFFWKFSIQSMQFRNYAKQTSLEKKSEPKKKQKSMFTENVWLIWKAHFNLSFLKFPRIPNESVRLSSFFFIFVFHLICFFIWLNCWYAIYLSKTDWTFWMRMLLRWISKLNTAFLMMLHHVKTWTKIFSKTNNNKKPTRDMRHSSLHNRVHFTESWISLSLLRFSSDCKWRDKTNKRWTKRQTHKSIMHARSIFV